MTTLKDIANAAGVSISTVSRIIRNDSMIKVNSETREKVLRIADELNYVPNQMARELVKGAKKNNNPDNVLNIGCYIGSDDKYTDVYFTNILLGIVTKARENRCSITLLYGNNDVENGSYVFQALSKNLSGIIFLEDCDEVLYKKIYKNIGNIIMINNVKNGTDCVYCNMLEAAENVVKYLIDQGHRRIAYIGGGPEISMNFMKDKRYKGYLNMLRDMDIPFDPSIVRDCKWETYDSYKAMLEILETDRLPTALFAACDMTAIGAMRAIHEKGLKIPGDIAVISVDNIEISQYTHPSLSTVDIPKKEMGEVAVQLLLGRINGDMSIPKHILLPTKLILREST